MKNATTATLTYDVLDHLVAWNAGSTNQEWYAYDASGNRVLRRSTTGTGTSITTYAFGLEEHLYGATGINTGNTYYYNLGGRIIGALTGITTLTPQIFLTDALGSVLATFSATAGSAAVLGNQIYGPYGNQRYTQGSMGTAKGYTGQYADATGLDYYNARYYDPVVGLFVSADIVQGNEQGMDPYAYVGENPGTYTDPTGQYRGTVTGAAPGGGGGSQRCAYPGSCGTIRAGSGGGNTRIIGHTLTPAHHTSVIHHNYAQEYHFSDVGRRLSSGCQADPACMAAYAEFASERNQEGIDIARTVVGGVLLVADLLGTAVELAHTGGLDFSAEEEQGQQIEDTVQSLQGACSFAPQTLVSTSTGKKPIVTLKKGEKVLSYNSKTKKMEMQPILHVWVNHDHDLVDLTITYSTKPGKTTKSKNEVLHTNKKHPFLTIEKGFLPVGQIKLGMHVVEADGKDGMISGWKVVPNVKTMYNLEVAHDHTFVVGMGQWIVHNDCGSLEDIFKDPSVLKDMTPDQIKALAEEEGWQVGTLGKGSHQGQGLIVREVDGDNKLTGRMIQWHPGEGHHGPDPYWKVSSGRTGTIRVGPQF